MEKNTAGRTAGTPSTREHRSVLIVDDEAENLRLFSEYLQGLGFNISVYDSGTVALSAVRDGGTFDLVMTDFRMPGMNGIEFVEELRKMMPGVPVIMLTGYGDIDTYFKAFSLGIFEYVNKPVDRVELRKIVKAALKQSKPKSSRTSGTKADVHTGR